MLLTKDSAVRISPDSKKIEHRTADRSQFSKMPISRRKPLPLVGLYLFDGDLTDASGNERPSALPKRHGVTFVPGREGKAARFNPNAKSFIDLPIDVRPSAMPKVTMGAWVRPRNVGPDRANILSTDIDGFGRTLTIDRPAPCCQKMRSRRFVSQPSSAKKASIEAYFLRLARGPRKTAGRL